MGARHQAPQFRQARAALRSALQRALQLRESRVVITIAVRQAIDDRCLGDVEAGANLRRTLRDLHRRARAWCQQQTAIGFGGLLVLQHAPDPGLGLRVTGQQDRLQRDALRCFSDLAARQTCRAPLGVVSVGIAQRVGGVQSKQRFDLIQQGVGGWFAGCRAKQQATALTAKRHAIGKFKTRQHAGQSLARGHDSRVRQPRQSEQLPGQRDGLDAHRDVLEFRLLRRGAEPGRGQGVDAQQRRAVRRLTAQKRAAPVHGHADLADTHGGVFRHGQHDFAMPAAQAHELAGGEAAPRHVVWVHVRHRLRRMAKQATQHAGARHAVPLVAQPAGDQAEGVVRAARLGHRHERGGVKARAAIGGGIHAVYVQAGCAYGVGFGEGPLVRPALIQQPVGQPGDVKIASPRALAVLVPHVLG